jgi:hypothetical protein
VPSGRTPRGITLRIRNLRRPYRLLQSGRLLPENAELPVEQMESGKWFSGNPLPCSAVLHQRRGEGAAQEERHANQEYTYAIPIPDAFHALSHACHLGNKIGKREAVARTFCRSNIAMSQNVLQWDVVLLAQLPAEFDEGLHLLLGGLGQSL